MLSEMFEERKIIYLNDNGQKLKTGRAIVIKHYYRLQYYCTN